MHPNMRPFTFPKAVFYTLKGRLSQCERRPFITCLIVNRLQGYALPLSSYSLITSCLGSVISLRRLNHTRDELLKWRVVWLLIM